MRGRRYAFKSGLKRFVVFCFDLAGELLFSFIKFKPLPPEIKKILVVRLDHLGDVLMVRPSLQVLRSAYPNAQIDFLTSSEAAPLMRHDNNVSTVLTFKDNWFARHSNGLKMITGACEQIQKLSAARYDLAFDFRGDLRTILLLLFSRVRFRVGYGVTGGGFLLHRCPQYPEKTHQVEVDLELLKSFSSELSVELKPASKLKTRALPLSLEEMLIEGKKRKLPLLAIHPAAGYPSKMWPMEYFQSLIHKIADENRAFIILLGTELEKTQSSIQLPLNAGLDLRGKTSLEDLPALYDYCDLYLGNDSGPAHLAATQGLKVISLFSGTNDPVLWRPWGPQVRLISYPVPCSPCEAQICPLAHHDCMRQIKVEEVFRILCDSLKAIRP